MVINTSRPAPGVALIEMNRPERLNALSQELSEALIAELEGIAADPQIGAVVLTGAGRGFCAGGDINAMRENRNLSVEQRRSNIARMHRIPSLIRSMPQVVITAINGPAYGAGFALALTGDIILASERAVFGTAFLKRGLATDFGLSYQLVKLAGPLAARRLLYLDEPLSAQQALAIGLVTEVVEGNVLMERAGQIALQVAAHPAQARGSIKRLLEQAETLAHQQMVEDEVATQIDLLYSAGHAAAVDAFLDQARK